MKGALRASILALLLAPFVLLLLAAGLVFVWENLWLLRWIWIPIPFCWFLGFLLYRFGRKRYGSFWQPRSDALMHWTDRDRQAWRQVVEFADQSLPEASDRFFAPELYVETTTQLAKRLASHYHPTANDAWENLTIPEILTAAELAITDIRQFVEQNIPGSHLMTIRWLQRAPKVTRLWRNLRPLYYAASVIWHPWTVLSRAAADETVVSPVMNELKKEGMSGLYRAFVLQLGKYLIELNSHRLRVGPDRWRDLMEPATRHIKGVESDQLMSESPSGGVMRAVPPSGAPATAAGMLQIVLVGQVKAGKSSLVNALLGEQQAAVDILPLTSTIERYTLQSSHANAPLALLDTVGYAHEGLRADRVDDTMQAICDSAMILLVMNACDAARDPDVTLLQTMQAWFQDHPHRRRPPVLVVLTHIDQLSPSLEWAPPYDGWVQPKSQRPKERSIREAVLYVRELLGPQVDGVVPVCTDMNREQLYGVDQWVVPAILNLLPQAKAKQLLDALYDQRDQRRVTQLMTQLWNAASTLAKYHFCGADAVLPQSQEE